MAETLGVFSDRRAKAARSIDRDLLPLLVSSAERTLTVPSATVDLWLPAHMSKQFADFGRRLQVLAAIYSFAETKSSAELADEVIPVFIGSIQHIPSSELPRVVSAVQDNTFRQWKWRRTELNVRVLAHLDNPTDTTSWSLLCDVVDIVEITDAHRADLKERFEEFAEELTYDAESRLDDPDSLTAADADESAKDMEELEELADRWGIASSEAADLAEAFRELARERQEEEEKRAREAREARSGQLALFHDSDLPPPGQDTAIFEHL